MFSLRSGAREHVLDGREESARVVGGRALRMPEELAADPRELARWPSLKAMPQLTRCPLELHRVVARETGGVEGLHIRSLQETDPEVPCSNYSLSICPERLSTMRDSLL